MDGTFVYLKVSFQTTYSYHVAPRYLQFSRCDCEYSSTSPSLKGLNSKFLPVGPIIQAIVALVALCEIPWVALDDFIVTYFVRILYLVTVFQFTPRHCFEEDARVGLIT